eukprot:6201652-Pleurochrysis_carterae.AAC.3
MLAFPEAEPAKDWIFGIPASLPSAVEEVYLEQKAPEHGAPDGALGLKVEHEPHALQLTVKKSVPMVGWLLLVAALTFSQSGGCAARNTRGAAASPDARAAPRTPHAHAERMPADYEVETEMAGAVRAPF